MQCCISVDMSVTFRDPSTEHIHYEHYGTMSMVPTIEKDGCVALKIFIFIISGRRTKCCIVLIRFPD